MFNQNKKPKTPKSPASPTVGDLFQAERPSSYLSNNDLSPALEKEPQQGEEHSNFQPIKKFSVLAKVKEKARKWKQNLGKKKPGQDGDTAPSWGVAFEDYEKDEDSRRVGTPSKLFTSRRSSSSYKEGVRLRAMPGLSFNEKHILSYSADRGYSEHCQKLMQKESISPNKRLSVPSFKEDINKQTATFRNEPPSYEEVVEEPIENHITDFESEEADEDVKIMPLNSPDTVEEEDKELNQICLNLIQSEKGRIPTPSPEDGFFEDDNQETESVQSLADAVTEKLAPECSVTNSEETQMSKGLEQQQVLSLPAITTAVDENEDENERKWDRGVSVKEYIKNKLEPGEDERALSQVISEAISPRRTPGDKGVMEKVKEAVTLLLLAEQRQMEREQEHKQKNIQQKQEQEQEQRSPSLLLRHSSSSLQIPISTNAYEDELEVEEESHGRILQAN